MSKLKVASRITNLASIAVPVPIVAANPGDAPLKVRFTLVNDFMVIVPVSINGAGPFSFLLDTGTSRTMVNGNIADRLPLPKVGQSIAVGMQDTASVSLVHANIVSMGESTVADLKLTVLPRNAGLPKNVNGILGEDFLERFDLLIDYRHHVIELESGEGSLDKALGGERLPIRLEGVMQGSPVVGRLIVWAHAQQLGERDVSLLLDSGVNYLVIFGGPQSLGNRAIQQSLNIAGSVQSRTGSRPMRRTSSSYGWETRFYET